LLFIVVGVQLLRVAVGMGITGTVKVRVTVPIGFVAVNR
jgi:hypothetical protein